MLTFGSLFAGIGGIDLGLERAGMTCKWQVEIDGYARRVLEKHWPNVRRWDDIKTFPPDTDSWRQQGCAKCNGQSENWEQTSLGNDACGLCVDLIAGGFPCQDISYAGKGAGLAGNRSGLFYEAMRVVSVVRPRFVLLENVAALLTRGMGDVLGTLASFGYDCEWHCIPAAAVGAPHIRDRVFIIADAKRGERCRVDWREKQKVGLERRSQDSDARREPLERWQSSRADYRSRLRSYSQWWATEPDVGRVAHGIPSRVDRLKGLGNAVVPQVAEFVGRMILDRVRSE